VDHSQQGTGLASNNGKYSLKMQEDGNLVFYEGAAPLWSSETHGNLRVLVYLVIFDSG